MIKLIKNGLIALSAAAFLFSQNSAIAAGLIRDTEIETTIRFYTAPLFKSAGINSRAVNIFILNDPGLNAFVSGGQNLFLLTGLLRETEKPEELVGVLAHEIGHIAGGHLVRTTEVVESARNKALIVAILGAAAAIALGRADAGAAIISGGNSAVEQSFLRYSRAQESAADQAALRYLDDNNISAEGLRDFLLFLQSQELLTSSRQSRYAGTHPLTRERVEIVQHHLEKNKGKAQRLPEAYQQMHRRMIAKLDAFIQSPSRTLREYPDTDKSVEARYARAIAMYRQPDLNIALRLTDELISDFPEDPYFHELKGQMLLEHGRIRDAIESYREANRLLPGAALIEVELGRSLLALNDPKTDLEAVELLSDAVEVERNWGLAWRQLAIGYGRTGAPGMAALSLAEEAAVQNRWKDAGLQAKRAQGYLKSGTPGWLRALDIEELSKQRINRKNRG